jgi:DNA-binding winged helix-turn-helix (wHTH) protein/tetratricopeptide (TPR) repeat protein
MTNPVYQFGEFTLHPFSRELKRNGEFLELTARSFDCLVYLLEHRERPVGKDELMAAVWGRVDVSESLLARTIVHLRRALGDTGSEQRCIKTISRVGYRWIAETKVVSSVPADTFKPAPVQDESTPAPANVGARDASRVPWLQFSLWITLLLMLIGAGYWQWHANHHKPPSFNRGTAIVLPAEVSAPDDWKWLSLGLMNLITGDLRQAKIPVESSQTVLSLLDETDTSASARFASFAWVIHPHITLIDNVWHAHLDATSSDGGAWQAEASSDDVLDATRLANEILLAQIGVKAKPDKPASDNAKEEYLLRMYAAWYAGSTEVERELIDKAPPDIREMTEFGYETSLFYCSQDELALCKQELAELLQRLPADQQPTWRGRVLAQQWYVYYREHNYPEGEAVLTEAVQLLQKQSNTGYLAFAYAQRGELDILDGKFDQAASDFGLARVNYALAGDTAGALGIDESLADLAMDRGKYDQALSTINLAYEQYQRMGMRQFLPGLIQGLTSTQKMLLQHADELATTDRYWPFEQKHWEFADGVMRHMLVYDRARALADNGRTTEASRMLEPLLTEIKRDPNGEPGLQSIVEILLARLAFERGDIQGAQSWISGLLAEQVLERNYDKRDYAEAWLTDVLVKQRAGNVEGVRQAVSDMQTWAAKLPEPNRWIAILLMRAQAAGAWSEGRHDQALSQLKLAMSKANELGVPELVVDVGQAYTQALLAAGKVDEAVAVSGQLTTWSQLDWRAAWAQASVYRALGQVSSADHYRQKARELAGDRVLVADDSVFIY